jgi:hypothetical protein
VQNRHCREMSLEETLRKEGQVLDKIIWKKSAKKCFAFYNCLDEEINTLLLFQFRVVD